ncbi:MAG TPA: DUF2680 domain-containing protein [Clostridiales bacterium]|nr:DUF2680 domain-containing protein [Clostridiales bacterium]
MKNMKKFAAVLAVVAIIATAGAVFAADLKTPVEIVSGLTGKSVESLSQERAAGKTYGAIAMESGKLDEFKVQILEQKKALLDQKVKGGTLTQEKADEIYNAIKENIANCDGSGATCIGRKYGVGFGSGSGACAGNGICNGTGAGNSTSTGIGASNGLAGGMRRGKSAGMGMKRSLQGQGQGRGMGLGR